MYPVYNGLTTTTMPFHVKRTQKYYSVQFSGKHIKLVKTIQEQQKDQPQGEIQGCARNSWKTQTDNRRRKWIT